MKVGDTQESGGEDLFYHGESTLGSRLSNKERNKMELSYERSIAIVSRVEPTHAPWLW